MKKLTSNQYLVIGILVFIVVLTLGLYAVYQL
jgi:hypothetical protein